ncbi:MAG TPA: FHA domain-containing protein [Planctomycetaceae bacterium]|nr:FHA domain-containing protein [Planctomycetaceae bacterium]
MSTATDNSVARLIVAQGANRGGVYALTAELTGIGQAAENQVVLADPELAAHHATIARRNNRFALFVPEGRAVLIDSHLAPNEQWVWLPATALLQLTDATTLKFVSGAASSDDEAKTSTGVSASRRTGAREKKAERNSRKVAKFVTDRAGATLVRLGEDGQLPELQLKENLGSPKTTAQKRRESNPAVLYAVLACSILSSVVLLFLDLEGGVTAEGKAYSRLVIVQEFLGEEQQPLLPYQRLLRDASLAHSRGDAAGERDLYRRVLRLLNSEDRNPFTGVTGSTDDDERLRHHLGVLLSR